MTDETKKPNGEAKLPDIKRERVEGTTKTEEFTATDKETGKTYPFKEERFTEKEIESTHLTKIAPLFYFCPDNNKVLLIPFSIQFSPTEILKLVAGLAHNLEKALKQNEPAKPEEDNEQTGKN